MLNAEEWYHVEQALAPAPDGSQWRAINPPRCLTCHAPIGKSMSAGEIYYLVYPGSAILDDGPSARTLAAVLRSGPAAS
jgi:hypothetical protein